MNINSFFNKINIKSKKDKTSSENSNFGVIGKIIKKPKKAGILPKENGGIIGKRIKLDKIKY